jgi:predicted RNA methylase
MHAFVLESPHMVMNEYIREYEFDEELAIPPVKVCQSPDESLGHGATVWDAALVLCAFLESSVGRNLIGGTKCVELGAGTGIVALAADVLGAAESIATDQEICIPFLRQNIGLNSGSKVKAEVLDWKSPDTNVTNCDWILCADCVYDNSIVDDLVDSIARLNPKRGVIVSNEKRTEPENLDAEKKFIKGMYAQVGLVGKAVHPEVIRPEWRCEDIHVVVFERKSSSE